MPKQTNILLPTAYFPNISYFAYFFHCETAWIEQMETFRKQTYRNRCEILTVSGKASLVVPVIKPQGNHTMTKDIEICYRESWQKQHWKSIQTAYRSSPYFTYYTDIIQPLFETRETLLFIHNHKVLLTIADLIGMDFSVNFTKDYEKQPAGILDLRMEISPKKHRPLISFPEYPQVFSHISGFMANLSILDLLFNLGPEAGGYLKSLVDSR